MNTSGLDREAIRGMHRLRISPVVLYCSGFFEVDDSIQGAGIDLEGEFVEDDSGPGPYHGPDVASLVDEGYQLINVG